MIMDKFTKSFLILGSMMVFTYVVSPDIQTTWIAIESGVNLEKIKMLWIVSLIGIVVFMYLLYSMRQLP